MRLEFAQEDSRRTAGQGGFTLTELLIAMVVFTLIAGSVVMLLTKSQAIFRTEQGVSEMDQNARMVIDFLTRDIQQSKENALGLGSKFRSIYSDNGPEGRTDAITIVSSDTESEVPAAALPLVPATTRPFSVNDGSVELIPNGAGHVEPWDIVDLFKEDEEFIVSTVLQNGSVQFDFIKAGEVKLTRNGTLELRFAPVAHEGVESEVPFGSTYEGGAFTMRPVTIKRYFIDKEDKAHPRLSLSINDSEPMPIARNVVAFQLRYLEVRDGEVEGQWVKEQSISGEYKTLAVEVTMTARTEIEGDEQAERLVTLASVIRPRHQAGDGLGSSGGTGSPGLPGDGGGGGSGDGDGDGIPDGGGTGDGPGGPGFGPGAGGRGPGSGGADGSDYGADGGAGGFERGGYRNKTKHIGEPPKLGRRLKDRLR
jgi:prepilin-type N-terminal cleavage/methylation domain-containing protein